MGGEKREQGGKFLPLDEQCAHDGRDRRQGHALGRTEGRQDGRRQHSGRSRGRGCLGTGREREKVAAGRVLELELHWGLLVVVLLLRVVSVVDVVVGHGRRLGGEERRRRGVRFRVGHGLRCWRDRTVGEWGRGRHHHGG